MLLGLGGGSVIQSLRKEFGYQKNIVTVELDVVMIRLAKEEFGIQEESNLQIVEADAIDYLKRGNHRFDLIIVDIFIDNVVPDIFYGISFWEHVTAALNIDGTFIFNAGFTGNKGIQSNGLIQYLEQHYSLQKFEHVVSTNDVLIGRKSRM